MPVLPKPTSLKAVCLQQPKQVHIGCGTRLEAVDFLRQNNLKSPLLIASGSCLEANPDYLTALAEASPGLITDTAIPPEPTVGDLRNTIENHRAQSIDAVVAMGGGSVIDIAKLVAVLLDQDSHDISSLFGRDLVPSRSLPLIALPTTSGAGSEVSPNAILFDEATGLKQAVISPRLIPDMACIDPELTVSLPPALTAATGLDALCHCIEAYTNKFAHPLVDRFALDGIRLIGSALVDAVQDGTRIEARTALAIGSYYGGLCLGPVNTAAVHALSYPLGSAMRLPHGISNAVLLPSVFRYNLQANPERHAEVGRHLGLKDIGDPNQLAQSTADHLEVLLKACNIPSSLSDLGVPREKLPLFAVEAMKVERLLRNNPRPLDLDTAEQIYITAY